MDSSVEGLLDVGLRVTVANNAGGSLNSLESPPSFACAERVDFVLFAKRSQRMESWKVGVAVNSVLKGGRLEHKAGEIVEVR